MSNEIKTADLKEAISLDELKTDTVSVLTPEVKAILKAGHTLAIELPESISDLKNLLLQQENQLAQASAKQGFCFLALKEKLPHGEFQPWLEQCGFNLRTVRRKMQVAQFLANLPEDERPKLAGLGQQRLIALAKLDPKVLDELLDGSNSEESADLESLSYKEMRERIRKLEAANADLEVEQETKDLTIRTLNDRASQRRNFNAEYPDFVNVTRDESNALSTEVALRLDELERLVNELEALPPVTDSHMVSLAVTNLQIHLRATAARACQLTNKLSNHFGDLVTELSGDHLMSSSEIEQAIMDRNTMTQEMEQQKRIREDRREAAKPRKPGRPKNS